VRNDCVFKVLVFEMLKFYLRNYDLLILHNPCCHCSVQTFFLLFFPRWHPRWYNSAMNALVIVICAGMAAGVLVSAVHRSLFLSITSASCHSDLFSGL